MKNDHGQTLITALGTLQLRGLIGCVTRSADRILPRLMDDGQTDFDLCRDIVDMGWSFAAGEPATVLETWRIAKEVERFRGQPHAGDVCQKHAMTALRLTALAAQSAFEAIRSAPDAVCISSCRTNAEKAVKHALRAGGTPSKEAFEHDLHRLQQTHAGDPASLGVPFDCGPTGELGPLWGDGEPPDWWHDIKTADENWIDPTILPVEEIVDPNEVRQKSPTIVCFFVAKSPTDIDDPVLRNTIESLLRLRQASDIIRPYPVIVTYVPQLGRSIYLELTLLGTFVVTQEELDEATAPTNVFEFAKIYDSKLHEWANPRIRSGWRHPRDVNHEGRLASTWPRASVASRRPESSTPARDDAYYQELVRKLGAAFLLSEP